MSGPVPVSAAAVRVGAPIDHFMVEEELGRGGMGIVYRARDVALDRPVALKVLSGLRSGDDGRIDETALSRFFREARAQARLQSPHVVAIHFIGRAGAAPYFAMELVDGEPLEATLDRQERLDPERARQLMLDVVKGLAAAHAAGFIHRDIKPSNLLVDRSGHVKIADFGLAKPLSGASVLTADGVILGTPMYMAPEQTIGENVDHRADMYALGCTFFHLVAGQPPYEGENQVELLARHIKFPVPTLRSVLPHAPAALGAILERLMQKEPAQRYATYAELAKALEAAAPSAVEPAGFWVRGAAAVIDLAAGAGLVGIGAPFGAAPAAIAAAIYLASIVALHARTGQTLGKHLLRVRAERLDGSMLGVRRALGRIVVAAWLPILALVVVLATQGRDSLFAIVARAAEVDQMKALVAAFAVSYSALSLVWLACLALAGVHPEKRGLHDLLVGSRVVHVRKN